MTVQITIIGLGKIGTSIGLALEKHAEQVHRIGHDKRLDLARKAQKMGALDKSVYNLPSSVRDADLVLLTLPVDQIKETLKIIAPVLKEGAVVMDTSPAKQAVSGWTTDLLPAKRYYVGLTPALNPAHIESAETGPDAAQEDLFEGGLIGIVAPSGTASAALKLAADLARLLGSHPLFMDRLEVDSLVTTTHLLPQLLAAGLISATIGRPGWNDARKLAGVTYTQGSASILSGDTPEAVSRAAVLNQDLAVRSLDSVITALQTFREMITNEDEENLTKLLKRAQSNREQWLKQRMKSDWASEQLPEYEEPTMAGQIRGGEKRSWLSFGRKQEGE